MPAGGGDSNDVVSWHDVHGASEALPHAVAWSAAVS